MFVKVHIPFDILKQQVLACTVIHPAHLSKAQEIKLNLPLSEECLPVPKSHSNFDSLKSTFCGLPWFLRRFELPALVRVMTCYVAGGSLTYQSSTITIRASSPSRSNRSEHSFQARDSCCLSCSATTQNLSSSLQRHNEQCLPIAFFHTVAMEISHTR